MLMSMLAAILVVKAYEYRFSAHSGRLILNVKISFHCTFLLCDFTHE
jgi:hypothetical protein